MSPMDITPKPAVRELLLEPWTPTAVLPTPPFTPKARPTNRPSHARDSTAFPEELLLEIFELAVDAAMAENRCGYLPWLLKILSIGSVCRQWRHVLHGQPHPRFWRVIYLLPTRCVECLEWQLRKLRRSSLANLRLEIFAQPRHTLALDDSVATRFSASLREFVAVLSDSQVGHSIFSRCSDIRIQGSVEEWAHVLNGIVPLLPALTSTTCNFSAVCYVDTLTDADLSCPFPLETPPFPPNLLRLALNFVPLTSITWDWSTFTRLRSLDLYFHVLDPKPDSDSTIVDVSKVGNLDVFAMRNLLQNVALTLTSLRLGRWWTDLLNLEPLELPQPVLLPCLTDLTLIWYSEKNMRRIASLFTAPNLKRALLQDVDMTRDSEWQSLPTLASWTGLECLILRIVNPALTPTYDLRRLLERLVGLKRLHVQFLNDSWEMFFYNYLRHALIDPAVCPNLVMFTFGYESHSYRPVSWPGPSSDSDTALQSQSGASQLVSDKSEAWREGTPTEADSQAYMGTQESESDPPASAALTRLNTLMSTVSQPDLSNIMAALEDAVLEEVPLRTRESSMSVCFRSPGSRNNGGSQMSIDEGSSQMSIDYGESQMFIESGSQGPSAASFQRFLDRSDSQMSVDGLSQKGTGSGSQMSIDSVSHVSWVADLALSTIVNDMLSERRKHLPPDTLKAAVIPLRDFCYDRYC